MDAAFDRLLTGRLVLRRFSSADAAVLAGYRSNPEVARYQSWHKACAGCDTRNTASWRLLERLGFRREGELRETFRDHGVWAGEYRYGLLADERRDGRG